MQIRDGTGSGTLTGVDFDSRLVVTTSSALHAASLRGDAYAWNQISADIDATDCALLVMNQSDTRLLVISYCIVQNDTVGQMDFKLADCTGQTITGTAVTAVNLNRSSIKKPDVVAYHDETGSPAATVFFTYYQHYETNGQATTSPQTLIDFHDAIILGKNDGFGVDIITENTGQEITVVGYLIDA
jgi:hypothetical protein